MESSSYAVVSGESSSAAEKVCSIEDLLSQILAGLPLCSLRLFKSVCKRWLSIITHPTFNARNSPKGLLFQQESSASSQLLYVPLNSSNNNNNNNPIPTTILSLHSLYKLEVLHSCNGLLTCYDRSTPDNIKLYVFNPTTNQCRLLPTPHLLLPDRPIKVLALAFDPTLSPHYKILYACEDITRPGLRVHVEIYSSQTTTWRAYAHIFNLGVFITFDNRIVYWRGALHWLSLIYVFHFSLDGDGDDNAPHFIHVEDNRALFGVTYGFHDKLLVSRDRLLLVRVLQPEPPMQQINIYEMKDPDCYSAGWSLKYHLNLQSPPAGPAPIPNVLSVMLGDHADDSFLVLEVTGRTMLLRYNIASNTFHRHCDLTRFERRGTMRSSFFFAPSLFPV